MAHLRPLLRREVRPGEDDAVPRLVCLQPRLGAVTARLLREAGACSALEHIRTTRLDPHPASPTPIPIHMPVLQF